MECKPVGLGDRIQENFPLTDIRFKHRRVWGAAQRQTLLSLGIDPEDYMGQQERLQNKINNLDAQVKKVLNVMPIGENITIQKVIQILMEAGQKVNMASLQRSILDLVDASLVKRVDQDTYQRRAVIDMKPAAAQQSQQPPAAPAPADKIGASSGPAFSIVEATVTTPLDRLAALAQSLRTLATEIDDAVLEAEQYVEGVQADTKKLEQLRSFLKAAIV